MIKLNFKTLVLISKSSIPVIIDCSGSRSSEAITKFFVSNLPEGCTPWELRKGLESFGVISGMYVAKKRDKDGCRFGFVSFSNVKNCSELERSLKGVKLGDAKLKINLARFALENSGCPPPPVLKKGKQGQAAPDFGHRSSLFNLRDARSFSEVLGKPSGVGSSSVDVRSRIMECHGSRVIIVPDRTQAFNDLFGVAVVGRAVDLETLVDLDKLLRIAKAPYSKIQYLGGLSVLVSFGDEPSASLFLSSRCVWDPWFSKLEAWAGQTLSLERVAWLNLHGIPLHLLETDVFRQVGEIFGKVLHVPKGFDEDHDLSLVKVGVLAGEAQRISEVVSLNWKGRIFRVWVEEEKEAWVPDCLGVPVGSPLPSSSGSPMVSSQVGKLPEEGTQTAVEPLQVAVDEQSPRVHEEAMHGELGGMHEEREKSGEGGDKESGTFVKGGIPRP
ncbi:putative RNA recognition motif domain, nucleotide-binding alpha-beta plait domain superfamily [Helianthus anomalus]